MRRFIVSAPIVAIASVEVMAESAEEACEIGEDVLRDGDTNRSIHVHHDFDIDREQVIASLAEEQFDLVTHMYEHIGIDPNPDGLAHYRNNPGRLNTLASVHRDMHRHPNVSHEHAPEDMYP